MDPIATLLLARTHTVVLDADRVASAATRPARDADVDRFEDELLQLGFVLSLDLAMTLRRLPHATLAELRNWMIDTLAQTLGAHRPHVPLFRGVSQTVPADSVYALRALTWVLTRRDQPCPWCGEAVSVRPLDPCGHLVCARCWSSGTFSGCPICHRRVAINDPFMQVPAARDASELVQRHHGQLAVVHLAFDLEGIAQARFERLLAHTTPLSKDDRAELETLIDTLGPKVAMWMPKRIPVRETMAIALARLWIVASDPRAMMRATHDHVTTATDVLRIAAVLMRGNAELVEPMRFASVPRRLRRAILEALERLPADFLVEDMRRHRGLWKRIGERLHPGEAAAQLPNVAAAFAAVRGKASAPTWAGRVEAALTAGDARAATALLAQRPAELLRRVDHLARVAAVREPDAIGDVIAAVRTATAAGSPLALLQLASHVARRSAPWPRRVFFPRGDVLAAYAVADTRAPLAADVIGAIVEAAHSELVTRAAARRNFARAVIDRGLADLLVPVAPRTGSEAKLEWPRGSEIALPAGDPLRCFLHWEEPPGHTVDLDLSVTFFDDDWQHVATCDPSNLVVAERAATHAGDLTSAPPPLGASELVELDIAALVAARARHAIVAVLGARPVAFDRLVHGFAGIAQPPAGDAPFDPQAVVQRFDLHGRARVAIPLAIDLAARRLRWLDIHVTDHAAFAAAGGYRATLAHAGRDFADFVATGARPTLWDVAAIHAAARANTIYVRDGAAITHYKRRDGERHLARLARLHAGEHDGVSKIPPANAPTWFALLRADVALPKGSEGYLLDPRTAGPELKRLAATDLVAELAR